MFARMRSLAGSTGIIWITAICVIVAIGCGHTSPLLQLQFANALAGLGAGGGTRPTTTPGTNTPDTIRFSCDLDPAKRGIRFTLSSIAQQPVRYTLTFIASAGPGGFVCAEDESDYIAAGYRDTVLDVGNGAAFGCDIVRLLGGTRLLSLRASNTIALDVGGTDANVQVAQTPLNGGTFIPLPELIVLGDSTSGFVCVGNNLCTQGGFIYTDIAGTTITSVSALRTQDTICDANAGSAPEYRLANPNNPDIDAAAFQYVAGGTVLVLVLDRRTDASVSNQVIWNVLDIDGNIIHPARP